MSTQQFCAEVTAGGCLMEMRGSSSIARTVCPMNMPKVRWPDCHSRGVPDRTPSTVAGFRKKRLSDSRWFEHPNSARDTFSLCLKRTCRVSEGSSRRVTVRTRLSQRGATQGLSCLRRDLQSLRGSRQLRRGPVVCRSQLSRR